MAKRGFIQQPCLLIGEKLFEMAAGCGGEVRYPASLYELDIETGRFTQLKGKVCVLHYLQNAFGIVALKCPKCHDKIQDETDAYVDEMSKYTYVPHDLLLEPAKDTWFLNVNIPAFTIRCWHCGFVFQKGRKTTRAERTRNERERRKAGAIKEE